MIYRFKTVLVFLILLTIQSRGQNSSLKFDQIGLEQGLSQSTVYAITQDAYGFMWFGTQDGLNRYDGYSIKVFKNDPEDPNSISDNHIWSLISDKNGDLWIGTTHGGVNKYVVSQNKFYRYTNRVNDSTSLSDNFVTALWEDTNGDIWIGTRNKGLNRYNHLNNTFTRFYFDEKDSNSLNSNTIWDISEDNEGNLWVATNRGLCLLKKELNDNVNFQNYVKNENILALYIDKEQNIWAGTWGKGIICFNSTKKSFKKFVNNPKEKHSLASDFIRNIFQDSRGILWIATSDAGLCAYDSYSETFLQYSNDALMTLYEDNSGILWIGTFSKGVNIYDSKRNKFKHYYDNITNKEDLNGNIIFALHKDKDGEIWAGTFNGLKQYDRKNDQITTFLFDPKNENSISSNKVLAICETVDGSIWVGTLEGLNKLNKRTKKFTRYIYSKDKKSISNNIVTALHEDKTGKLWIGYDNGDVSFIQKDSEIFTHFLQNIDTNSIIGTSVSIYEDKSGNIWFGTIRGGLFTYVSKTNTFKKHSLPPNTSNSVYSMYRDDSGYVWLGTLNGLIKYNNYSGEYKHYTVKDGLPNNNIWGILPDTSGNLWLSTNKGISRFSIKDYTFKNYDFKDGLKSNEFNRGAYFSTTNELLFGGMNGFYSFRPEEILENDFTPPVYITTFKIFNEILPKTNPITSSEEILLNYSQNFFSFEFVALNYSSPEKNQYAYILKGFDKDWHYVSSQQRYASYTNLDPGKYTLYVKGSNNDGIWNNKGTSISIIITPPFWMTWWFRAIVVLAIIIIVWAAYNYRVRKLRELDKMRLRIASDLHDEVGSDLGGLTLISQRLEKNNSLTGDARIELSEINKVAFQTAEKLRDIVWFVNPEHDKPEHFILRLKDLAGGLLKDKDLVFLLKGKISFENVDLEVRRQLYLIFKEVIYNIVKHANAKRVEISIEQNHKVLKVEIRDDGTGFNQNRIINEYGAAKGMGVKNIVRRSKLIGAGLTIQSKENNGTTVTFSARIP